MKREFVFTSESVTEGHPDKIADQISDAILDASLKDDEFSRVACETFITTGLVLVGGEITTKTYIDIPTIVRDVIRDIGYIKSTYGFDADTCAILTAIDQQASDIAIGVDSQGAGDQGMMIGYASNETPQLMPFPIQMAHTLAKRLTQARKEEILPYLRPDGKTQVSVRYIDNQPVTVEAVVVAAQHSPDVEQEKIRQDIIEKVIKPVIPADMIDFSTVKIFINPTGRFVLGGPHADTGLTGRKIIVDTYGGMALHGGGCFSGKDPTKVDRSGAYAARHLARNIVASGIADKCTIQVAYAIGVSDPVSLMVDTHNTGKAAESEIETIIQKNIDMTPSGIIRRLDLRKPVYRKTAAYGHYGRTDMEFSWEQNDLVHLFS